jgi:hypothetical protein
MQVPPDIAASSTLTAARSLQSVLVMDDALFRIFIYGGPVVACVGMLAGKRHVANSVSGLGEEEASGAEVAWIALSILLALLLALLAVRLMALPWEAGQVGGLAILVLPWSVAVAGPASARVVKRLLVEGG